MEDGCAMGSAIWVTNSDVLVCSGEQATWYLNGQLSANVESLAVGEVRRSLLLEPDGSLVAPIVIARQEDEAFALYSPLGTLEDVKRRLQRFKLRTKVMFEAGQGARVLVSGTDDAELVALVEAVVSVMPGSLSSPDAVVGRVSVVECVSRISSEDARARLSGLESLDATSVGRIFAGEPEWGNEVKAGMNPTELGEAFIRTRADFEKGCYTGQELVERVDSRGYNTPRKLSCFLIEGQGVERVPLVVEDGGKAVFSITSLERYEPWNCWIGLGFVHRVGGEYRNTAEFDGLVVSAVSPGDLFDMR